MNEIWKDIKGYEGYYQVSDLGRIKSLGKHIKCRNDFKRFVEEKIRKCLKKSNGYLAISLYKEKKVKTYYVHRIVAETFIENTNNEPTVNHINEIKTDNRAKNLEWMSYSENLNYNNLRERMSLTKKKSGIMAKENNPSYKNKEHYSKIPVERGSFKKCCKNKGWLIEEFSEVWKGNKNKRGTKKYYYIHESLQAFRIENYKKGC